MLGIFITARMGSCRLQNKHFSLFFEKKALEILIERVVTEFKEEIYNRSVLLVIVSGDKSLNSELEVFTSKYPLELFYGADRNIPLRHSQACKALSCSTVLAIDGDDILCCPKAMRLTYKRLLEGKELVKTVGLPLGMNSWGYSVEVLNRFEDYFSCKEIFETGWGIVFKNILEFNIYFETKFSQSIRATLDYKEDVLFFKSVFSRIPNWASISTFDLCEKIIDLGLEEINIEKNNIYWQNFISERIKEGIEV